MLILLRKTLVFIFIFLLVFPATVKAKTLTGKVGSVEYASDTQKGFELAKIYAEHAYNTKSGAFYGFFLSNDSTMAVFLTKTGDEIYALNPNVFRRYMREWVKGLKKVYGTSAVSVNLKESDGTTIGKATISIFSGIIKIKLY